MTIAAEEAMFAGLAQAQLSAAVVFEAGKQIVEDMEILLSGGLADDARFLQ